MNHEDIRNKYLFERDKRVRTDGSSQYIGIEGALSHYALDPYAESVGRRQALVTDVDVAVVGGGYNGLMASCSSAVQGRMLALMAEP